MPKADFDYAIHRDSLIHALQELAGFPRGNKIPPEMAGTFEDMSLKGTYILRESGERKMIPGLYDVIVKPSPVDGRRKSSQHRTFIICEKCSREIPTGRLHQHRSSCKI